MLPLISHTHTLQAIVLRTYDVGEADRFCVLFTRERGRIAARANGVRKLRSRFGGVLLPLRNIRVTVRESSRGWLILSAAEFPGHSVFSLSAFSRAEEGLEYVLLLTSEGEPLPEVYDLTVHFLKLSRVPSETLVPVYLLKLLRHLGHLPGEDALPSALSSEERRFVRAALFEDLGRLSPLPRGTMLPTFCLSIVAEQGGKFPQARSIAAQFGSAPIHSGGMRAGFDVVPTCRKSGRAS